MAKTLEDILKNEKPEVIAEAKRIADEMLKKIHDNSDDDSAKNDSDQQS
jgi:hypothetical protein